jgi:putative nucleotidyltransferase with HDIG domain
MKIEKGKEALSNYFDASNRMRWGILAAVTVIFTILLYPNLVITKHQYSLGDIAERDIKAPKDFFVEDEAATEKKQQQAMAEVLTVYDYDSDLDEEIGQNVVQAFAEMRKIIEAENVLTNMDQASPIELEETIIEDNKLSLHDQLWAKRKQFENQLGFRVSQGAFRALEKEAFSKDIPITINKTLSVILKNGVVTNKEILLKEMDKGIVLRDVNTQEERGVGNLKKFYGLDQAKARAQIIGQPFLKDTEYALRNLIINLVQDLVQPNITLNKNETQERKKNAAEEIKPVLHKIKAGEMLLREGERVTEVQLLKLKTLEVQTKTEQVLLSSLGAAMIMLCLLITTYILHLNRQVHPASNHNKKLLLIASVTLTFIVIAVVSSSFSELLTRNSSFPISELSVYFGVPLASAAMILCLFLGLSLAIPLSVVMAICFAVIFQNSFEVLIYFLINSTMAAYWIRDCRERKVFIKAGAKIGLLNIVLATAIDFYMGEFSGGRLLWDWAFAFLGGIAAGIVTAGIVPLIEMVFDYTTDITLLELANLDRPILRRLMIEAPGTYHHSMVVGTLVEAAASEIGANPLLARVCGYYHDIGKIKKPLYFVENQRGKNKHDKLAPSMSSLILIAHVKEGVEIAKQNKLGNVIIDTIKQHHGTSLIKFFYEKAKQRRGEDSVNIDDFRYPGPKPQTREAGLVMLADVVEAASRTLENPTPSRIQGLVQNLINKIFSDGQLDSCELTLKDLHNIAKSFNKILTGIHHHRIEYPEQRTAVNGNGKGKTKNGSPDRQQAKQAQNSPEESTTDGPGHLRRLGLS